ncbi:MAG: hypothetical protein GY856_19705 [bacterium]|nr:hypothetical protein [bacterium]
MLETVGQKRWDAAGRQKQSIEDARGQRLPAVGERPDEGFGVSPLKRVQPQMERSRQKTRPQNVTEDEDTHGARRQDAEAWQGTARQLDVVEETPARRLGRARSLLGVPVELVEEEDETFRRVGAGKEGVEDPAGGDRLDRDLEHRPWELMP